jgi:ankyrin repeat protein/L-ascorbate metabolism protein UlaG (beta-lactamase superfamily)
MLSLRVASVAVILLLLAGPTSGGEIHKAVTAGDADSVAHLLKNNPGLANVPDEGDEFNSLPLHIAAASGNLEIARLLIEAGATVDAGDSDETTPLCVAAGAGRGEMVALLIEKGADVNRRDRNGGYSLSFAASAAKAGVVRQLLESGADLDYESPEGFTLLQLSARRGLGDLFHLLLEKGHDVDAGDNWGVTPLHWAVSRDDTSMIRALFARGANPSPASPKGETPLWRSVFRGKREVVEMLLAHGADVNAKVGNGWTPLFAAAYMGNADLATLLLGHRADPNLADAGGLTPLMLTALEGQSAAAEALLAGGAAIEITVADGMTALHLAAREGKPEVVRLLAREGADVNKRQQSGMTPLSKAVQRGHTEVVEILLAAGARVDVPENHNRQMPLHFAAIQGYADIARLLLDRGAPVNEKDRSGKRPLDLAVRYGHRDVAEILHAFGAKGKIKDLDRGSLARQHVDKSGEVVMWYLGHSGWAVKTPNHLLVFDYYEHDRSPAEPGLCNGRLVPEEIAGENVTFFVTHEHSDHYDPQIFEWRDQLGDVTYVLGWKLEEENPPAHEYIGPRERKTINGMAVTTIESNDAGVGYVVEVDGLRILHAGDHANREKDLSGPFKPEIDYLSVQDIELDIAFMPIAGCGFGDMDVVKQGVRYALGALEPRAFIPMHCGLVEYQNQEFIEAARDEFKKTKMAAPLNRGDYFRYRDGKFR